ncbi:hypothetical protein AAFG07_06005 [Bradyrhizobium sp. B097]|uniref:hypothetical protein n=1 Tax=Bradyrhizobium sp. B097 TaxID=3140244 RepID=UPI0031846033
MRDTQPLAQFLAAFPANLAFRVFVVRIVRFGEVASWGDKHLTARSFGTSIAQAAEARNRRLHTLSLGLRTPWAGCRQ